MGRNRKERDYTLLKTTRHSIAYQTELERRAREEHKSVAQVQREDAIARIGAVFAQKRAAEAAAAEREAGKGERRAKRRREAQARYAAKLTRDADLAERRKATFAKSAQKKAQQAADGAPHPTPADDDGSLAARRQAAQERRTALRASGPVPSAKQIIGEAQAASAE